MPARICPVSDRWRFCSFWTHFRLTGDICRFPCRAERTRRSIAFVERRGSSQLIVQGTEIFLFSAIFSFSFLFPLPWSGDLFLRFDDLIRPTRLQKLSRGGVSRPNNFIVWHHGSWSGDTTFQPIRDLTVQITG